MLFTQTSNMQIDAPHTNYHNPPSKDKIRSSAPTTRASAVNAAASSSALTSSITDFTVSKRPDMRFKCKLTSRQRNTRISTKGPRITIPTRVHPLSRRTRVIHSVPPPRRTHGIPSVTDPYQPPSSNPQLDEWIDAVNSYSMPSVPRDMMDWLSETHLVHVLFPAIPIHAFERRKAHVYVDHSNLTVSRYAAPVNLVVLHAHIDSYANRHTRCVAGSKLTPHTMPGPSYQIVCNVRNGPERGLPDMVLIKGIYDLVDNFHAWGQSPETIVLCTGDGNNENRDTYRDRQLSFPAVVRYAIRAGWKVIIYAREGCCHNRIRNLAIDFPNVVALFLFSQRDGRHINPFQLL